MAKIIGFVQIILTGLIFLGDKIFNLIGKPVPEMLQKAQESSFTYCMFTFFLGNMLQANLMQTGAFEIYVDDTLVWSKLNTGSMPNIHQLKALLRQTGIDLQ